jgi:hypothetical protein
MQSPTKERRLHKKTESNGGDHHRCLYGIDLDVLGALSKPGINLLQLAAAQPRAGSLTLFENAGGYRKLDFSKKLTALSSKFKK